MWQHLHDRSTRPQLRTDLCNVCHPFYTGEQRIVDTAGQVERFMKRMEAAAGQRGVVPRSARPDWPSADAKIEAERQRQAEIAAQAEAEEAAARAAAAAAAAEIAAAEAAASGEGDAVSSWWKMVRLSPWLKLKSKSKRLIES